MEKIEYKQIKKFLKDNGFVRTRIHLENISANVELPHEVQCLFAYVYYKTQKYEESEKLFNELALIQSNSRHFYKFKGLVHYYASNIPKALKCFNHYYSKKGRDIEVLFARIICMFYLMKFEKTHIQNFPKDIQKLIENVTEVDSRKKVEHYDIFKVVKYKNALSSDTWVCEVLPNERYQQYTCVLELIRLFQFSQALKLFRAIVFAYPGLSISDIFCNRQYTEVLIKIYEKVKVSGNTPLSIRILNLILRCHREQVSSEIECLEDLVGLKNANAIQQLLKSKISHKRILDFVQREMCQLNPQESINMIIRNGNFHIEDLSLECLKDLNDRENNFHFLETYNNLE